MLRCGPRLAEGRGKASMSFSRHRPGDVGAKGKSGEGVREEDGACFKMRRGMVQGE